MFFVPAKIVHGYPLCLDLVHDAERHLFTPWLACISNFAVIQSCSIGHVLRLVTLGAMPGADLSVHLLAQRAL
jgi:hypothetical protein